MIFNSLHILVDGKSGTAPVLRDELAAALAGRAVPVM
jgi:hypothetical protein